MRISVVSGSPMYARPTSLEMWLATAATWVVKEPGPVAPTTYGIGNAFLTDYALPYEIASLVLLAGLE